MIDAETRRRDNLMRDHLNEPGTTSVCRCGHVGYSTPGYLLHLYEVIAEDTLASLDNADVYRRVMKVLDDNGVNVENGSIHSWRCFDKERYPEPCSCAAEVVVEIIQAVQGKA